MEEREKKLTEQFIQDLAFSMSDYFIFVVNDFTSKDQKILKKIVRYIENNKSLKSIIVIHNFKDVKEEESHRLAWTKQVLDIYRAIEQNDEMETK